MMNLPRTNSTGTSGLARSPPSLPAAPRPGSNYRRPCGLTGSTSCCPLDKKGKVTMEQHSAIFRREGSFVRFEQYGLKLNLSDDVSDTEYYEWLDEMIAHIGDVVTGGAIVEKDDARTQPRYNAGVY